MARFHHPTPEQEDDWRRQVMSMSPELAAAAVANTLDPWTLYRMSSTGDRCTLQSLYLVEGGGVQVTVAVTGEFNAVPFDRQVFGVDPAELTPCELPHPAALTGRVLTTAQVDDNIDLLRVMVRPDLWHLDATGRAIRKH